MERHEPHSPKATEPGPHPTNAERHGIWRIALISVALAFAAMVVVALAYGIMV